MADLTTLATAHALHLTFTILQAHDKMNMSTSFLKGKSSKSTRLDTLLPIYYVGSVTVFRAHGSSSKPLQFSAT